MATPCVWPLEEGENRARHALGVPKVEVIGTRIVEIDSLLDQLDA
jgi:hypothetical protein